MSPDENLPILPDYRAKRVFGGEWAYGIPVIDDAGSRIMCKRLFRFKDSTYDVYISSYQIDPSTLEIFSGKYDSLGEKIYTKNL